MAWVIGGKKFGQYTFDHWFDEEFPDDENQAAKPEETLKKSGDFIDPIDSTTPCKPPQQP